MNWRRIAITLLSSSSFLCGSCDTVFIQTDNETDIRVIDLGVSGFPVAWIDNQTILLRVDTGESQRRREGGASAVIRLAAYNYRTGTQQTFGRADSGICYSEGYVSSIHEDATTGELVASYGPLGKEISRTFKPGDIVFDRGARGSCRPWEERPPRPSWIQTDLAVWPLHPYQGFLNCNVPAATLATRNIRARFHTPTDRVGIEMPFSCYQVQTSLRYYRFKDAYFGLEFDVRSPWPEGRDRRVFWLHPNGAVQEIVLPYSDAIRDEVIPTARGLIAFSEPYTRQADYWVYLVNATTTKTILRGHARGVTSPDGCKVAILHDPEYRAHVEKRATNSRVSLKVLEICQGTSTGIPSAHN